MRLPHAADLPLPAYQSALAAGFDLHAAVPAERRVDHRAGRPRHDPDRASRSPCRGAARAKSGRVRASPSATASRCLTRPGTIDADYRGEIQVILINLGGEPFVVSRGMRIAQLVIARVQHARLVEAESLDATARAGGGMGSTGTG